MLEDYEILKIGTKFGFCYAVFPRGEIHCLIVGVELAANEFTDKMTFMVREHGYLINLSFTDVDEFLKYCNRADLGISISEEMTEKDQFNVSMYLV